MAQRWVKRLGPFLVLAVLWSSSATAQDTRSQFLDAKQRAEGGSWSRAMDMFQAIVDVDPTLPEAAWNAGYLASRLNQWETCALYYRNYLYRKPDAADADEALRHIDRCERRIPQSGTVTIVTADPRDLEIVVDGVAIGRGRVENVALSVGEHRIQVDEKDYDRFEEVVTVEHRQQHHVRAVLKPTVYYGRIKFTIDQKDAVVTLDGREIGLSPLPEDGLSFRSQPDLLLTVEKEGYRTWQRYIDIPRDGGYELQIKLIPTDR